LGIWDSFILQPLISVLIVLSSYLFNNLGLSIIILTVIINGLMLPLTQKQLHASKAMQDLQPKLAELKKKYAKDREGMAKEQMRLYKESGISPAGCVVPMLIQMPIWIALYHSIMRVLVVIPENFLSLSQYLYPWPVLYSTLPLGNHFLWLDLAQGDIFLALLVGGTMWLQQKMVMSPTADPKQQAQGKMMLWMMPIMFAFLTLSFPSGLALFWVTSNVFRIAIQYFATGWGGLAGSGTKRLVVRDKKYKQRITQQETPLESDDIGADIVEPSSAQEEGLGYAESGDKRQDRGGGSPTRLRATKHRTRGSKGHRPKRR